MTAIRRVSIHNREPSESELWELVGEALDGAGWDDDEHIRITVRVYTHGELPSGLDLWQTDQLQAAYSDGGTCCVDLRLVPYAADS